MNTDNQHPILVCHGLTKVYTLKRRQINVLNSIDLTIHRGETIGIAGRSGSGKSTLLQLLAGIDYPTAGTVTVKGRNLQRLSETKKAELRRSALGIVFQNFNLLPSWTVLENVEAPLMHTPMTRKDRREKARDILERMNLADRLDHLPAELSMGQQQRVAVARALIHQPDILLADEPTGDVDPGTGREIMTYLVDWVREHHVTLVVATHGGFPYDTVGRWLLLENSKLWETRYPCQGLKVS